MCRPLIVVCRVAPLIAGVGCAQIAGIEDTSGKGRPVDSLVVTRMSVGATVETSPLDLAGLTATYFVTKNDASVERVDATVGPDPGTWTTKLYEPAPVRFTLPDLPTPIPRLFSIPSRQLQILYGQLEHPGRTAAPDGATFTVNVTLDRAIAVGETFQTYVVGAWLARNFAPAELVVTGVPPTLTPPAYSFTAANSVPGRAQVDLVTTRDAFLVLRYAGAALTGVASAPAFDQTEMSTVVPNAQVIPVIQDRTLDVKITPSTLVTRYTAVRPAVTMLAMSWGLTAAPGYKIASNAGPSLYSGTLTAADGGLTVQYGNPFTTRGWNTMFVLQTSESRVYTPTGATVGVTLNAGLNQFLEPPPPGTPMTLPAGLPILIQLDGTPLSTDGQSYKTPTQFAHVEFDTDIRAGAGSAVYNLQVSELRPNPEGTVVERILLLSATSSEAVFDLPPELFQTGRSYTLRAIANLGGYPTASDGNFLNRELPLAQGYADSAVITVVP